MWSLSVSFPVFLQTYSLWFKVSHEMFCIPTCSHTLLSHLCFLTECWVHNCYLPALTHTDVLLHCLKSVSLTLIFSHPFTVPESVGETGAVTVINLPLVSGVHTHTYSLSHSPTQPFFSVSHTVFASLAWSCSHSCTMCLRQPFGLTDIFSHTVNFSHIHSYYFCWCDSLTCFTHNPSPKQSHLLHTVKFLTQILTIPIMLSCP